MNFFGQGTSGPQPESYEINGQEYHELNLIAEGGYGFIWRAIETKTRKFCVIKKIICQSKEAIEQAQQELDLHRRLQHPNIVKCYNGVIKFNKKINQTIAYMVLELCEGGTLIDLLKRYNEKRLSEQQVLLVLKQLVQAIKYLHTQKPSITHRDLKVENVLLHNKIFKICDFGSASTEKIDLNQSNKHQISQYEENFAKQTTEIYRPPEMTDLYLKYEINEKVDIWMLGCILYTMCFYNPPFQESSKLAIVEASYIIPKDNKYSNKMINLIGIMLQSNPKDRASIFEIEEILNNYETLTQIQCKNGQDDDFGEFQQGDQKAQEQQQKTVQYDDSLI
ncbi:unnamed protein product [Paramecium pentaurelia]|uniref:non-specific serine/threonine protein kinase n=1 Tax=Paramecium pentaurelia TaxID=43138 RepID=A0A8S1W974_9CILI|nr:unnamed protein product [Paramecium pentaurelia]